MKSTLCWIVLGLWIVTIVVAGWFFVQGWTAQGNDGRTLIVLAPAERDLILGEMRLLLKAVHGVRPSVPCVVHPCTKNHPITPIVTIHRPNVIQQSVDLIGARCPCHRFVRVPAFAHRRAHPKSHRL